MIHSLSEARRAPPSQQLQREFGLWILESGFGGFDGCRIYLVTPAERKKLLEGVKQVRTFDTLVASLPPGDPLRQRVNNIVRMTAELDSADRVDGAEIMAWETECREVWEELRRRIV
jgi:hypothetical protein